MSSSRMMSRSAPSSLTSVPPATFLTLPSARTFLSIAHREDVTFRRLLLGRVGNDDAAFAPVGFLHAFDDDAIVERPDGLGLRRHLDRAMIIAVLVAGVVEVSVHEVVVIIAMRYGRVPAAGAVLVLGFVPAARMRWRTARRVVRVYLE